MTHDRVNSEKRKYLYRAHTKTCICSNFTSFFCCHISQMQKWVHKVVKLETHPFKSSWQGQICRGKNVPKLSGTIKMTSFFRNILLVHKTAESSADKFKILIRKVNFFLTKTVWKIWFSKIKQQKLFKIKKVSFFFMTQNRWFDFSRSKNAIEKPESRQIFLRRLWSFEPLLIYIYWQGSN